MTEHTYLLEYIWIDAYNNLRSKTKIMKCDDGLNVENCPYWTFDGSSTGQAESNDSDVILKPCKLYLNPLIEKKDNMSGYLVLCETYDKDRNPHKTNYRWNCRKMTDKIDIKLDPWFGIEQEYIIYDRVTMKPYMWNSNTMVQGPYYCGCGGDRALGRQIAEKHVELCLKIGLKICGINAEVTPSQWEFQIGPLSALDISDELWIARYLLNRISEEFGCWINYHPKPMKDYNGSGCHTNFSTFQMRQDNGYDEIIKACQKLSQKHAEHLMEYGEYNDIRLTGHHETSNIHQFSYAEGNRGSSIRIPLHVVNDKKGYLEDRRPGSNMDPYRVTSIILKSVCLD